MTFNFSNIGKPIAIIIDGKYNGSILSISINNNINQVKQIDDDKIICDNCGREFKTLYDLTRHKQKICSLKTIDDRIDDFLRQKNINELIYYLRTNNTEVKILDNLSVLQYIPSIPQLTETNASDSILISGACGSGKSYWVANYIRMFMNQYPNYKIVLFSRHKSDDVFKDFKNKIYRIELNDDLLNENIDVSQFRGCLVILDDIETANKKLTNYMFSLRNDFLKNFREHSSGEGHTFLLNVTQETNNGHENIKLIRMSTGFVIFPKFSKGQYTRLMANYLYMDKGTIDKVYSLSSRWVYINRCPSFILHEKGAFTF